MTHRLTTGPAGRRRVTAAALLTGALAVGMLASGSSSSEAATDGARAAVVTGLNAERAAHHLRAYREDAALDAVARVEVARLSAAADLRATPRITTLVRDFKVVGANVSYGTNVDDVRRAVMADPVERANLLSTGFEQVGVGVAVRAGRVWVVEVFKDPLIIGPRLHRGSQGRWVRALQRGMAVPVTGRFDALTDQAVRRLQASKHLRVTGVTDRHTWCALKL